eukprot:gene7218-8026_t
MPDISDLSKKNARSGKTKSTGSASKSRSADTSLSLNAALESALMERPSRPTPPNRPVPVITDAMSDSRIKKNSSGYRNIGKPLEESSSAASSPGVRKHTPATIPRTKFTSATPLEQRVAINRLKQRLDFAEREEDPNAKQGMSGRSALIGEEGVGAASAVLYDQESLSSRAESIGTSQIDSDISEMVDMSRILQRLNQVRDYLKQATSLYVNLSTKDQLEKSEIDHIDKLGKLIQQLRVQEQGYVDLLQRTLDMDQAANMTPSSSVMSLKQSEADEGEDSQQELSKLKMQHSLLKRIVDQQQQIQDLKKKQATLAALQEQAEEMMRSAEIDEADIIDLPNNLRGEIHQNVSDTMQGLGPTSRTTSKRVIAQDTEPAIENTMDNEEAALLDADMAQKRLELENKLMNLQEKKLKMDELLRTLKSSRDALTNSAGEITVTEQSQQTEQLPSGIAADLSSVLGAVSRNNQSTVNQQSLQEVEDVKEKLRKLKEAKQRLQDLGQIQAQTNPFGQPSITDSVEGGIPGQVANNGGARPRNRNTTEEFSDGLDNRMRPAPPGGRFPRQAIDMKRNQSSLKEPTLPRNIDAILASEKNLAAGSHDENLTSKIRQLQEAKQRLAAVQRTFQMPADQDRLSTISDNTSQTKSEATSASESENESENASVSEDLIWQDDPEFEAKVRRLQHAKEKLKHLQNLVNSAQFDGISMDDLVNISLSSKASSEYDDKDEKEEDDNEEEEDEEEESTDEEDETTTEQESQTNEDDVRSVEQATGQIGQDEESDGRKIDQASTLLDREIEYQLRLSMQKKELERLLREKQNLLEAQRQLSEIARGTLATKEDEESAAEEKQQTSTRESEKTQKEVETRQTKIGVSPRAEKTGLRVTYKDMKIPRIVKRTSNLSVEPQFGSDSDFRVKRNRAIASANKHEAAGGRPSNPLVMSELRRQREMFEQNKKLKFVEKQRRRRDSGDDRSDGGTYSIRSDIDEGVGVSMFSADVTTAATWGGSTEQSSTEEDSAVEEDDYPEEEAEIEDDYEGNLDQPEEEEEEIADEESEEDVAPLFDFKKKKHKKQGMEKPVTWFDEEDERDRQRGKKRKLDSRRADTTRGSTVSWSMNVSPESSRHRRRQQNLTPAHKLLRNRPPRAQEQPIDSSALDQQCDQLRQQLANSNTFSTTLLRNQQTLLTMLQNQFATINESRSLGFPPQLDAQQNVFGEARAFQSPVGLENRSFQILQALNRCTSQLDRQCHDIQQLQREFQHMSVNPLSSARQRVYPWENPSPMSIDSRYNAGLNGMFRTSANAGAQDSSLVNNSAGLFQQNQANVGDLQYRPGLTHSATSPHAFMDDTENRHTQTDILADIVGNNIDNPPFSLFSQAQDRSAGANERKEKPSGYSPFRFYDYENTRERENAKEFSFPTSSTEPKRSANQDINDKYDPLVYTDATAGAMFNDSRADVVSSDVITTSYPTPSKSAATRNLADLKQKATWPSFLKDADQVESASDRTVSQYEENVSRRPELANERSREKENVNEDASERMSVASNFSLFETMRDSIYSEVATLISMNESRPHYLVELFRELQLLTSDYLRQRALYSLQDLVTRFLTEDSETRQTNEPSEEVYQNWIGVAAGEQTPTESIVTTDTEDQEAKALEALSSQIRNNDMYDYAEIAETGSTMSTPTSCHDPPFAAEGLGDTVINLDEALQNMRSYEEKMAEARRRASDGENNEEAPSHSLAYSAAAVVATATSDSSAYEVNSEASSDIQQPSIDTQKLDRQIKAIMLELIPFLNEHMEAQCTQAFLSELKDLILKLAKEKEPEAEKQEFGRSFHRQLESVLKDSLNKFESRSLKECGEDILIDISEILFNELAFFRLMQDLDRPMSRQPGYYWRKDSDTDGYLAAVATEFEEVTEMSNERESASAQSIGLLVNTTGTLFSPPAPKQAQSTPRRSMFEDPMTIEDIEDNGSDAEDETEASRQLVNVELSVSESRPVTSTGSGEEDVEEDQQTFPVHHLAAESSIGAQQQQQHVVQASENSIDGDEIDDEDDVDDIDEMPEDEEQRNSPRAQIQSLEDEEGQNSSAERAEDEREEDIRDEVAQRGDERDAIDSADNSSAQADVDRINEDTEDNEITVDDLPSKLTGLTEADLQTRMQSEQEANDGAAGILADIEQDEELAGESNSVPQPDQLPREDNQE